MFRNSKNSVLIRHVVYLIINLHCLVKLGLLAQRVFVSQVVVHTGDFFNFAAKMV